MTSFNCGICKRTDRWTFELMDYPFIVVCCSAPVVNIGSCGNCSKWNWTNHVTSNTIECKECDYISSYSEFNDVSILPIPTTSVIVPEYIKIKCSSCENEMS